MTYKARLLPSRKEFEVHEHESMLDAGLRAGLSLNYSCSNGSCGECRAKLVSGQVQRCNHHDFVFSEAEKGMGYILLCSTTAETDVEIEAVATIDVGDIPIQQIEATVYKLDRLNDQTMVLTLRTPRSQNLRFLAGQHVTLNIDGVPRRNKSIASCPCNARHLQFHVRNNPGDPLAKHIFNTMQVSDRVTIEGPWGVFTLDEASRRPILLLAYETGFAPMQSIMEHIISLELCQPIHLYWLVDRPGTHYLGNYVRTWVDALDNFSYTPLVADLPPGATALDAGQRAAAIAAAGHAIANDYPDLAGHDVYLCGPDTLVEPAVERLLAHGLPADRLFVDTLKRF